MKLIDPITGKRVRNAMLDEGHAAKASWVRSAGTPYPKGRMPADFEATHVGYEGARALRFALSVARSTPDIIFYPNGQVDLYCPGRQVELSMGEAFALARLLNGEKPDPIET